MRSLLVLSLLAVSALAADVPVGEVTKYTFDKSKVFPGTTRDYWVYIPKQYDGKTPACVHVNQDGIQFGAVKDGKTGGVFDALIAAKKMPVTIGVFIRPGVVKAVLPNALDRFNRSYEYDGLGDNYARFLLDELLPDVETKLAADGRKILLSHDGNDRSIGGSSSGAIAAFTAAWERPDAFRRVFSSIGTYVGLRGGNEYPTLIRKVEPKPLRIYLEDGSNDQNIYGGDWWMANQSMERSLKFMGYDVEHKWGDGGHNAKHATEIFPEAMTWLWRDYPKPIVAGAGSPDFKEILIPGEGWKIVGKDFENIAGIAADYRGCIFFSTPHTRDIYRIVNDAPEKWLQSEKWFTIQDFGPDGRLYGLQTPINRGHIGRFDVNKNYDTIADDLQARSLVMLHNGTRYATVFDINALKTDSKLKPWQIWRIDNKDQAACVCDEKKISSDCLTVSPDQSLLYSAGNANWIYSYQIQLDGTIMNGQKYFHLHVNDRDTACNISGMHSDRDGRLWVATEMGLQVCDQAGRVHCIIPVPGKLNGFCFGGPEFDTLYCTCGDKVYSRKVKVKGALPFLPPIKPAPPKL